MDLSLKWLGRRSEHDWDSANFAILVLKFLDCDLSPEPPTDSTCVQVPYPFINERSRIGFDPVGRSSNPNRRIKFFK